MIKSINNSIIDITLSFKRRYLIFILGWQDIKQRYRRSKLGPFWLTISMGTMIGMIGLIFGQVFGSPMKEFLPYLSAGIIFWTFISSCALEGSGSFINSAGMIRQLNLPLMLYVYRVIWRNVIVLVHNLAIVPVVFIVVGKELTWNFLWIVPGFIVLLLNITWMVVFLATICTRFRDMPQIVDSLQKVFFYLTPVIWMPNSINPRSASLIVDPNPFYHLLQLVRAPILGVSPEPINWIVTIAMCTIGTVLSMSFFGFYKKRIAYWI